MSVKVIFNDKSKNYIANEEIRLKNGVRSMCSSIKELAYILAPVDTGELRSSGRINEEKSENQIKMSVSFGGKPPTKVAYAKMRHYVNKKNPQTLLYLERAGDSVVKKGIKDYIKQ